jgi:hypothetical protein
MRDLVFRAWLVFAVAWILIASWLGPQGDTFFADIPSPRSTAACVEAARRDPQAVLATCIENVQNKNWNDAEHVAWILLPPIFVLLAILFSSWLGHGFKTAARDK